MQKEWNQNLGRRSRKSKIISATIMAVLFLLFVGVGIFLYWDRKPPEVTAKNPKVEYNSTLKLEDLVEAIDDRSEEVALTVESITPDQAVLSEDGKSITFSHTGSYQIVISARDSFKNESRTEVTVEVIDKVPPELKVNDTTYVLAYNTEITVVNANDLSITGTSSTNDSVAANNSAESMDSNNTTDGTMGSNGNSNANGLQNNTELLSKEEMEEALLQTIEVNASDDASEEINLSIISVKPLERQTVEGYNLSADIATFHKLGAYEIEIQAEDAGKNQTILPAKIQVIDQTPPALTETENNYTVSCDKKVTVVQTKSLKNQKIADVIDVTAKDELSDTSLSIYAVAPCDSQGRYVRLDGVIIPDTTDDQYMIFNPTLSASMQSSTANDKNQENDATTKKNTTKGKISNDYYALENGSVQFKKVGDYHVWIQAKDKVGNAIVHKVDVKVADVTPPEFAGIPDEIELSEKDIEYDWQAGVTATDAVDGDVSDSIEIDSSDVQYTKPGVYKVIYTAKDSAGNEARVELDVRVKDETPPVLTIPGPFTTYVGDIIPDFMEGASAKDAVDGNLAVEVDTSDVDFNYPGTYVITYYATDHSGNSTSMQTTVRVEEAKNPSGQYIYWSNQSDCYHQSEFCPDLKSSIVYSGTILESGKQKACKKCF